MIHKTVSLIEEMLFFIFARLYAKIEGMKKEGVIL
ncbi:Uncharacterised protein [Bacillus tequilensis]|nr:Uncharacterised protein [Bacillus tequilensis]